MVPLIRQDNSTTKLDKLPNKIDKLLKISKLVNIYLQFNIKTTMHFIDKTISLIDKKD